MRTLASLRWWAPVFLLAGAAWPAAGQAFGVPVSGSPVPRGVTLHAMTGFPNDAGGGGRAGLLGVSLGARRAGVTGFVSGRAGQTGELADFASVGAAAAIKVFGGPLVPFAVQLQGGAAYASPRPGAGSAGAARDRRWHVPVGVGISWVFPQPAVAVRPWLAPRLDYTRVTTGATEFGLSGGLSFGFLNGLAVDVAYDRVFVSGGAPSTFGFGLSYTIR